MKFLLSISALALVLLQSTAQAEQMRWQNARLQAADGTRISVDARLLSYSYFGSEVAEVTQAYVNVEGGNTASARIIEATVRKLTPAASGTTYATQVSLSRMPEGHYSSEIALPDNIRDADFSVEIAIDGRKLVDPVSKSATFKFKLD